MSLDLERLRRDIAALGIARSAQQQGTSGAMGVVRAHLADIERLKDEGATWVNIAEALAEQGVRRRDGGPITGRRLTGLIDSIRRQDTRRRSATERRASRRDLTVASPSDPRPPPGATTPRPSPAGDEPQAEADAPARGYPTAEQIRRDGLAELDAILKGKKP